MISWIVTSSVLILIITALRYLLRGRISLRLQYALWLIVLVRLLIPLEIGYSPVSLSAAVEQVPMVQEIESMRDYDDIVRYDDGTVTGYYALPDDYQEVIAENKTDKEFARMKAVFKLKDILMPVWVMGVLVTLFAFFRSNIKFGSQLKKQREWFPASGELPVYTTEAVDTPCLFGLFRPAIYVTPEAAADEQVLNHTLEHELTHYRHRDNLWAVLRCVALALHWYNPLVWWAAKLSRDDAELACDEATLMRLGEDQRACYGRTLIQMTCQGKPSLMTTATTMTGSQSTLKERIALIAKKPKMAVYTLITVVVIAVLAAVIAFAGPARSDNDLYGWLSTVGPGDMTKAYTHIFEDDESRTYSLTNEYKEELTTILNGISKEALVYKEDIRSDNFSGMVIYSGEYDNWDKMVEFECYDSGMVSAIIHDLNSDNETGSDKKWWIDSTDLYWFIMNINNDRTSLKSNDSIFSTDLDYDGEEEQILIINSLNQVYTLQVIKDDGTVIWEGEAGLPHLAWTTYMLYTDGTSRGILHYTPAVGQGFAGYSYEVLFLDGSETPEYLKGEASFPLPQREEDPIFADYEYDPMEVIAFLEDINYLMEHSVILLSTEGGELIVGPESPQFLIDDNIELVRQLMGQDQQPYDVADEMKKVKASDITELDSYAFTAGEIASALNAAAGTKITASVAANRAFSSANYLFWYETAYLEGSYETGISGANLAFRMECGLAENIVKVTYGRTNLYSTGYFESEELYTLLRYRKQPRYGEIDQDKFEEFSRILKKQMDHHFNVMSDSQPIYDYELIEFHKVWTYKEADGATVELYDFDYGLMVNNPEKIQFAGGMHLDGYERLRGFNGGGQLAVRYRDGEMVSYAFMGNDFWYNPAYPEDSDWAKDRLKAELDYKETPPMYTVAEIQDAIEVATKYFNKHFKGCTLKSISYGGDDMSKAHKDWADRNGADEVIVLTSDFYVAPDGGDGSLNQDTTYVDWKWILVRGKGGKWRHADHGY